MGAYLIDAYLIDAYFNDDWGIDALRGACWGGACRGRFSLGWAVVRVCGFVWVGKKIQRKYRYMISMLLLEEDKT